MSYSNDFLSLCQSNVKEDLYSLKLLIEQNPEVLQERTNYGRNGLYLACQYNLLETAKLLLDNNMKVDSYMIDGWTPLYHACHTGNFFTAKFLLEHKANLNKRTVAGFTPLHAAVQNGHYETVALLLQHGADVNKATSIGTTPLMIASYFNHLQIAKLLLENEANHSAKNKFGKTALDCSHKRSALCRILEKATGCMRSVDNLNSSKNLPSVDIKLALNAQVNHFDDSAYNSYFNETENNTPVNKHLSLNMNSTSKKRDSVTLEVVKEKSINAFNFWKENFSTSQEVKTTDFLKALELKKGQKLEDFAELHNLENVDQKTFSFLIKEKRGPLLPIFD
ncbi:hypothetical protein HK099_008373 [Clydaea vesicula]|uniref:Uncharacterized protein n=1 Tax=Clydaea vesicula TaxID=447962 RepID=A0AAD5U8I2_9FUNG|nr:hypothetical protein HK099_008373 [Clydaea vesicula]KAJ3397322.1 hypothetical protein HDU92_008865 [Lobulomyces angularis]